MTLDEFKADLIEFLESSTVNLGRRKTKTRLDFINAVKAKFDSFQSGDAPVNDEPTSTPMSGSVIRIKPSDRNRALDAGKGVHAMTSSESQRADEQLNRSPYGEKKGQKNE